MNENNKIAVNSFIIFARLVISSLIGILTSRIVLDALGASDYGLYNVVGGIVTILNVFNSAMLSTSYRFIATEMGKGERGDVNKIFNTCFFIHAGFALLIIIFGSIVGEWYIDNYLNVALDKLTDAKFVFHISIITTAISTLLVPYQGLITSYEKFHVLAVRDVLTKILFFVAVCSLLYNDTNRIRLYACIQLGYNLIFNGSFFVYCKRTYKDDTKLVLKFRGERKTIREMFSFAIWTLFGAVANIGKTQGCVLLVNFFFGSIVNAAFAIAAQLNTFIETFARSLNNAAIPQITKNFSGGRTGRSMILTSYISKYTFIMMSFIAFPVLLEMDFLLNLWLKEVPESTSTFSKLMVLGGLLGTLGEGIPALVNATGNIKLYQIVYHTFNLLGLPIAWVLFKMGFNQYSILIVYCVIYFLSTFVRLLLLKKIYHFNIDDIVRISYIRIILITVPLVVAYSFYNSMDYSMLGHIMGFIMSMIYLLIIVIVFGIDKREYNMIKSVISSKVKNRLSV